MRVLKELLVRQAVKALLALPVLRGTLATLGLRVQPVHKVLLVSREILARLVQRANRVHKEPQALTVLTV